ncbi:hypothetical protein EB796_009523 [Bugula neritina]|uniref:ARHGAP26 n=1 Tax=Bugula neritina TaxID=10212 RepID=A0A7J7K1U5_BUGNE|nr:hypothetical protein EB796_009523 [Bugula neritina]
MVLQALEFSDCILDSPHFRERLYAHEKELDNTSKVIKKIIQEGKDLIHAAKTYAKAQRSFAQTLLDFKFETIGSQQTDEEIVISKSLKTFGELITSIEEARDTMMEKVKETFVDKLEEFRKSHIVSAKDERKRFEKTTKQYCTALEKHLSLKPGKSAEGQIQESDSTIESEKGQFHKEAMAYVMKLQEVHERKKFEFVEILLAFMCGWKTFYHQGYEIGQEMEPYLSDLGVKLNKTRDNFESTRDEASQLMNKMALKPTPDGPISTNKMFTRQGYLFAMEKKALGTVSWSKYFCSYQKEAKIFTMIPFHQTTSNAGKLNLTPDTMVLSSCVRRASESIERRFCFDITIVDRPAGMTLQALSDQDRQDWLEAMDGKEPVYAQPVLSKDNQEYSLDSVGFTFVHKCVDGVESRGLKDQGLYRVVGVNSKVNKLMLHGLDPKRIDKLNLSDPSSEYEVKTITSALKNYFRKLSEPVMTFKLHQKLMSAAKLENKQRRVDEIGNIVRQLPTQNFKVLSFLIGHLRNVAADSDQNMMGVSNLSVCFGPTLLRPEEETVAAIMDIKFCNLVVEILIANYEMIFSKERTTNGLSAESAKVVESTTSQQQQLYCEESVENSHLKPDRPELYGSKQPIYSNRTPATPNNHRPNNQVVTPSQAYNVLRGPMSKSYDSNSPARNSSYSPPSSVPGPGAPLINRRVRALYACEAENESELSFEISDIIYNVRESREPGWLEGTLNGKTGLLPANYVEYIP